MDKLTANLLEPLTFEDGEISKFVRDNRCADCLGVLQYKMSPGRKWTAYCFKCGPTYAHNYISRSAAERAASDRLASMRELR